MMEGPGLFCLACNKRRTFMLTIKQRSKGYDFPERWWEGWCRCDQSGQVVIEYRIEPNEGS